MNLITNLKLSEVDNLSDARFAAGMGARFIGFPFDEENENYLEIDKAKEIAGWLSGPDIVAEFGAQDLDQMLNIIKTLKIKYVQLNEMNHFFDVKKLSDRAKIIQNVDLAAFRGAEEISFFIEDCYQSVHYFLFSLYDEEEMEAFLGLADNRKLLKQMCIDFNVILNFPFDAENLLPTIEKYKPYGVNFYTEGEERPGYKDFNTLIDLTELLEKN